MWGGSVLVRRDKDSFLEEAKGRLRAEGTVRINQARAAGERAQHMQRSGAERVLGAFEKVLA